MTGSVGSVTGAVGSVTAMVSANATQFAGTSTTGILSAAGVFSAAALANAPTGSSGGSGSYNVTLTITDGTNPLPNATVTLAINASRYTAVTNSSGVAVLTPTEGNGTYTVSLTAIGYQFTPASLTVSGNTSHSYAMAQITITPATAPAATGWLVVTQSDGVTPEVGQIVNFRMIAVPPDSTGLAPDPTIFPVTSIAGGMVQASFLGLATYQMKTGRQQNWSTFVAGASGTTFAIQSALI